MSLKIRSGIILRDFQDEAVKFTASRPASLLSMKTGTGKSLCCIASYISLLNDKTVNKVIVVGTKSSIIELENDMVSKSEYDDGSGFIPFKITDNESLREFYSNKEHDVAILQYEKINNLDLALWFKLLNKYGTAIFCDESHRLKNPKALLTRSIMALRKAIKVLVFLTATPLTSSIVDLYYQIQILNSGIFKSRNVFMNTFVEVKMVKMWKKGGCYPEIVGYKNLELLREKIKPICYDYYPKQDTEYIIHRTLIENVASYSEAASGLLNSKDAKVHAARFADLQHVVDKSKEKIKLYIKAIKPHLKEGLITYCHYHETIDTLSKVFDKLNLDYKVIHGQITTKERKNIKEWFNSNPSNKILLITNAGSQSLNLQSVNNMFFYDMPSGFGQFSQAKGRVERLFSKHVDFHIHFILTDLEIDGKTDGTIDAYKYELISSYGELTQTVLNADEVPKSQLTSFNKKMLEKFKKSMLWRSGKKCKTVEKFGDDFK